MKPITVLALGLALFCTAAAYAAEPLLEPAAIAAPAGLTAADVEKAIRLGLLEKKWRVEDSQPGLITGVLLVRAHQARVTITYSTSAVNIRYLDSQNLRYDSNDGQPVIHGNYNKWVSEMAAAIQTALGRSDLVTVQLDAQLEGRISAYGPMNPEPKRKFSSYSQFELKPVQMGAPWAGQPANDKALEKIQELFSSGIQPLTTLWNEQGKGKPGSSLVIEPKVEEIKFIGGAARFFCRRHGGQLVPGDVGALCRCRHRRAGRRTPLRVPPRRAQGGPHHGRGGQPDAEYRPQCHPGIPAAQSRTGHRDTEERLLRLIRLQANWHQARPCGAAGWQPYFDKPPSFA